MADIFIVEDDPVIAREMDNFLTSWGHNVKCAQDFKNVTAEFADFNPQLVLLDISLPFWQSRLIFPCLMQRFRLSFAERTSFRARGI